MATEIERKFLVTDTTWKAGASGRRLRQGYLTLDSERTVRVRATEDRGWLTVKGQTTGCTRLEFEVEIPVADANALLENLCLRPIIDKTRYEVRHGNHRWEIDEFHGANEGLVVAEIELNHENEAFELPAWLGLEVSGDARFYNARLVRHPFSEWDQGA